MGSFRAANIEEELAFIEHCKEWIRKYPIENKSFESQYTYLFYVYYRATKSAIDIVATWLLLRFTV